MVVITPIKLTILLAVRPMTTDSVEEILRFDPCLTTSSARSFALPGLLLTSSVRLMAQNLILLILMTQSAS